LLCFLILNFLILGVFTVQDLLLLFICFEATMIPLVVLVLRCGPTVKRISAVKYIFVYTGFSGLLLLLGTLYLYKYTGTTNLLILSSTPLTQQVSVRCAVLFCLALALKIPLYPFHLWLPQAHVEAPTAGSVILAALLLKVGGYTFIKVPLVICT